MDLELGIPVNNLPTSRSRGEWYGTVIEASGPAVNRYSIPVVRTQDTEVE